LRGRKMRGPNEADGTGKLNGGKAIDTAMEN